MFDLKEELKNYDKILTLDDLENSIKSKEISDLMGLLQYIANKSGD